MRFLVDALAAGDVAVARYYFRRGAYVAAVQRSQDALKQYPDSPALQEALVIMVLSYEALNLPELRTDVERVLRRNFPAAPLELAP
jgi:outer membrane protein assembly factor BamD